jgi:hypothetical protein
MQGAHHLCGTVGALGLACGSVRLQRPGGGLGVGGVVLTEPAPVLTGFGRFTSTTSTPLARRKRANPTPKLPLPSMPARSNVPNSSTQATNAA